MAESAPTQKIVPTGADPWFKQFDGIYVSGRDEPDVDGTNHFEYVRDQIQPEVAALAKKSVCATAGNVTVYFSKKRDDIAAAQHGCAACPGRASCGELSLLGGQIAGTWGGVSEKTRDKIIDITDFKDYTLRLSKLRRDHPVRVMVRRYMEEIAVISEGGAIDGPGRPDEEKQVAKESFMISVLGLAEGLKAFANPDKKKPSEAA